MTAQSSHFGAVVLAAGQSRRMGCCKSLLPLREKPVLAHVLDALGAALDGPIVVVTGHQPQALEPVLSRYTIETAHNPQYEAGGMISSIKVGLSTIDQRVPATFVVLGDQPLIGAKTLRVMMSSMQTVRCIAAVPVYQSRRGHPVLLGAEAIAQALSLESGLTLRDLLNRLAQQTLEIEIDDPAILMDMDTIEDYQKILSATR